MGWNDWWQKPVLGVSGAIIAPFFALGAGINELTGGASSTYNVWTAANNSSGTTYSPTTQALSGYTGADPSQPIPPGGGTWGLPILNPATPAVIGNAVDVTLKEVGLPDLKTLALVAVGVGAVVLASK